VLIYLLRSLRARKAEAGKDKSVIFVNRSRQTHRFEVFE
jgi:hypothetical protein